VSAPCLCILKAGATFAAAAERFGDFEHWLARRLALPESALRLIDLREDAPLPAPQTCAGAIMTGSHAMITEQAPWMRRAADWLPRLLAARRPYLGICFGHQMLAHALGGKVDFHPRGREIGTVDIQQRPAGADDALFRHLPARFRAHAVHAQTVVELPPDAVHLAGNDFEPHHAFRVGEHAWGIQFHPEFDQAHMLAYLEEFSPKLLAAGQDVAAIRRTLADTPEAAGLLAHFARLALAGQESTTV
jgi:GMP synthase (glutamine-hydrolysing)